MSTFTNITNSQTILKNSKRNPTQLHKKLAFKIFHVVPNIENHGENREKLMQAKKIFIFERLEAVI